MIYCTFAGHSNVFENSVQDRIKEELKNMVESCDDDICFYNGGMGDFDYICANEVLNLKHIYPNRLFLSYLVLPYMKSSVNEYKEYYESMFDDIIVPIELADIHYKRAITERNKWLIDHSSVVIVYVYRDFGGAYNTFRYAKKKGIKIINIFEKSIIE